MGGNMKVFPSNLSDFLSQNSSSFYIPPFQRAYSWSKNEVDRYFDDIVRIIESEKNISETDKREHFFGVLVLKNEKQGLASLAVIVDGQQRITTTLLLLIALRDMVNNNDMQKQIEDMYLKNPTSTFSDKIKLKQVTKDWDAYCALINGSERIASKVTDGYNYFYNKIENLKYTVEDYILALSRVNIAYIVLDERPYKGEDPQVIFETLNSLGKPLSFADLIRNYIMLGLPSADQTEIYEKIWHPKIENVLHEHTSRFFRDFMQYKDSKSFKVVSDNNTKELYALFTHFVDKHYQGDKKTFVTDIYRFAELYRWIAEIEPKTHIAHESSNNTEVTELLRNIFFDIKAEAFKPMVLGLLEFHHYGFNGNRLTDIQLINALTVIRTYLLRRRILKLTQGENKEIPSLCNNIRDRSEYLMNDSRSEMLKLLSGSFYRMRFPDDMEVANELKRIDFYNGLSKYSKLILGKIEENCSKVSVDYRDRKITIEHVMPQTLNKKWKEELGDNWEAIQKQYLHNIGNLILTEFNSEIGNKSLSDKKEKLQKSNLMYRTDVINRETWNEYDMSTHQMEMIKRFLTAFSLPVEMQQANNWDDKKVSPEQELISPLDDDSADIATGKSPKAVLVNDELFNASTWQDVYLVFLRWLHANKPVAFSQLLNKKESNSKYPLIAVKQIILSLGEEDKSLKSDRYKRLSDGVNLINIEGETEDEPLYVHINASASTFISRIREAMILSEMGEETVTIELNSNT